MRNTLSGLILALATAMSGAADAAIVIYSNFGPGDSFNENAGYPFGSPAIVNPPEHAVGFQFTAAQTGFMTSIDLATINLDGIAKDSFFTLYADNGANDIGAALETVTIAATTPTGLAERLSGVAAGSTLLTAGTKYWMIATSPGAGELAWNLSNYAIGNRWSDGVVSQNSILGVLRINGVPEPGTFTLLGIGLFGFSLARRRCTATARAR
jgi:hypothetical protein